MNLWDDLLRFALCPPTVTLRRLFLVCYYYRTLFAGSLLLNSFGFGLDLILTFFLSKFFQNVTTKVSLTDRVFIDVCSDDDDVLALWIT